MDAKYLSSTSSFHPILPSSSTNQVVKAVLVGAGGQQARGQVERQALVHIHRDQHFVMLAVDGEAVGRNLVNRRVDPLQAVDVFGRGGAVYPKLAGNFRFGQSLGVVEQNLHQFVQVFILALIFASLDGSLALMQLFQHGCDSIITIAENCHNNVTV